MRVAHKMVDAIQHEHMQWQMWKEIIPRNNYTLSNKILS